MSGEESRRWPGYSDEAYPEVFTTMPTQPKTLKPGQISEQKARQFFDEVLRRLRFAYVLGHLLEPGSQI